MKIGGLTVNFNNVIKKGLTFSCNKWQLVHQNHHNHHHHHLLLLLLLLFIFFIFFFLNWMRVHIRTGTVQTVHLQISFPRVPISVVVFLQIFFHGGFHSVLFLAPGLYDQPTVIFWSYCISLYQVHLTILRALHYILVSIQSLFCRLVQRFF
jgi:hypothetical protein